MTIMMTAIQNNDKRILDIYTMDGNDLSYLEQLKLLDADKAGLAERDLMVKKHIYSKETAALFKAKHINHNFVVTLTGKDNGEKFRSEKPVLPKRLYGIIDVMPMRKDEMKAKQ